MKVASGLNYFKVSKFTCLCTQITFSTCSGTSCNTLLKDPHSAVSKEKQQLLLHRWIRFLFCMIMSQYLWQKHKSSVKIRIDQVHSVPNHITITKVKKEGSS